MSTLAPSRVQPAGRDAGPLNHSGAWSSPSAKQGTFESGDLRQQVNCRTKLIMRWQAHRGGALDFKEWCEKASGEPFPSAVAFGRGSCHISAPVTPGTGNSLSEYAFLPVYYRPSH